MIAVNIQGGLGNQLFEYAFAYATAKRLHTCYMLDNSKSFVVSEYFCIPKWERLINRLPYIRTKYRAFIAKLKAEAYVDRTDCWQNPKPQVQNNAYYDGFFQSVVYFRENELQIRRRVTIRHRYQVCFKQKYSSLYQANKIIAVHIRRQDYLTHGKGKNLGADDLSLPREYYIRALQSIPEFDKYKIIVVGDDIEWAKENLSDISNAIFAHNEMIVDFQIMLNADVVICSNGTFAWWAAYLNGKTTKQIIAPKYFLGYHVQKDFPSGIYSGLNVKQIEF